jgi:hypothetical protein
MVLPDKSWRERFSNRHREQVKGEDASSLAIEIQYFSTQCLMKTAYKEMSTHIPATKLPVVCCAGADHAERLGDVSRQLVDHYMYIARKILAIPPR